MATFVGSEVGIPYLQLPQEKFQHTRWFRCPADQIKRMLRHGKAKPGITERPWPARHPQGRNLFKFPWINTATGRFWTATSPEFGVNVAKEKQ
jgi:hypothetical protein